MPVFASRAVAFLPLLFLFLSLSLPAWAAGPQHADVRVLIDISGSMRQNDPNNLRRPALRMLAGLMQPGTRAGVWTFARWVNNLVPVSEVDGAWKQRVAQLSEQIGSPGQFTNVEEVLERAAADWSGEPTTHARHLLLLTDGMVDVSRENGANAASRARILAELLPRLRDAGVRVHTVALSAQADHELMRRLAGETGGHYQQVARADELQRIFLRMFETVATPDAVPLEGNRFVVDSSISEATVLVFSRAGSPPVVLRSPGGAEYSDSDLPAGVAWHRDQGYDLITIAAPEKGEWTLQADVDPDNRVMVVTDLKLQVSELPAYLAVGEPLRIEAHLSNRGELVDRQAFLRLLEVQGEAGVDAGERVALALNDLGEGVDGKAGDGRYAAELRWDQAADGVEVLVAVDSPTFTRQKRFRIAVHEPLAARVTDGPDGPLLELVLEPAVMQTDAVVRAWQAAQGTPGPGLPLSSTGQGAWVANLADPVAAGFAALSGSTRLGNLIEREYGPLMPPGVAPPPQPVAPVATPEPTPPPEPVEQPAAVAEPAPEERVEQVDSGGWLLPGLLFGGFNLLLLGAALAWYLVRRRRAVVGPDDGLEDLLGAADGEVAANPGQPEETPREAAA
jgi:hypothetical protein